MTKAMWFVGAAVAVTNFSAELRRRRAFFSFLSFACHKSISIIFAARVHVVKVTSTSHIHTNEHVLHTPRVTTLSITILIFFYSQSRWARKSGLLLCVWGDTLTRHTCTRTCIELNCAAHFYSSLLGSERWVSEWPDALNIYAIFSSSSSSTFMPNYVILRHWMWYAFVFTFPLCTGA